MGPHGINRLLTDLGYEATDRRVLVLAWKFTAQTQCEFSLDEWVKGMTALQADTVQNLRQRIDSINSGLESDKAKVRKKLNNWNYLPNLFESGRANLHFLRTNSRKTL